MPLGGPSHEGPSFFRRYEAVSHIRSVIRRGKARILHIARHLAKRHRARSPEGISTKRGYDRDEYPLAAAREGGTGADVRYGRSSDNSGAGSSMGSQLRPYCNGQAFRFRLIRGPDRAACSLGAIAPCRTSSSTSVVLTYENGQFLLMAGHA